MIIANIVKQKILKKIIWGILDIFFSSDRLMVVLNWKCLGFGGFVIGYNFIFDRLNI